MPMRIAKTKAVDSKTIPKKTAQNTAIRSKTANDMPKVFDAIVEEGDLISFDPTGEKLRVTKIDGGKIVFEKTP